MILGDFVLRTKYNADKTELENKIPDVSNLATKIAFTTVENKMLLVLLKNIDYHAKVTEIEDKLNNHNHGKYITTPEFSTLTAGVFNASLEQANLVRKTDFDNTVSILDSKIATNKTKQWVYWKWVE